MTASTPIPTRLRFDGGVLDRLVPPLRDNDLKRDEVVLSVSDVSFYRGHNLVLDRVSLTLRHRDFLAVLGPNGGGKTTLLKLMLGLLSPSHGRITLFGYPPRRGRRYVGYVPQVTLFDRQFPISVHETVLMGRVGRHPLWGPSVADHRLALDALTLVGLPHLAQQRVGALSGGELQRVLMARALATQPRLLMLDEPTANVDAKAASELAEIFSVLATRIPLIVVSHDISTVLASVNHFACLNRRFVVNPLEPDKLTPEMVSQTYGCTVDWITRGAIAGLVSTPR